MGKRGPPSKPSEVKRLEGTYRPDRAAKAEMKPPPAIPAPPDWLKDAARQEWERVVPVLAELGVLTAVDGAVLEAFCANYGMAVEYQQKADAEPMVETMYGPKVNPAAGAALKHWALAKQLGAELGLSPSARTRVSAPEKPKAADPTEDFLFTGPKLVKPDGTNG